MMGLHSPFGYVDYEVPMAETFIALLDKFCASCHTDEDFYKGCKNCPVGNLLFECQDYILSAYLEDEHHQQHTTEEWAQAREEHGRPRPSAEELARELAYVKDYKPECDVLREMKVVVKTITPHPLFYIKQRRPSELETFARLTETYKNLEAERRRRWFPAREGSDA